MKEAPERYSRRVMLRDKKESLLSLHLSRRYLVTSPPTKSPPRIELSLAFFWTFMSENSPAPMTVDAVASGTKKTRKKLRYFRLPPNLALFSYLKEMTSGCKTFLLVFNFSNVKVYIHMTSRRPCWCSKPILWELNSFLMQTLSFVSINLHRCWPREWKHSIRAIISIFIINSIRRSTQGSSIQDQICIWVDFKFE